MRIFSDLEGGRIITSNAEVGAIEGVTEALVFEIAATIGNNPYRIWLADYERRGSLEGFKRALFEGGESPTLSVEESTAAVHGLFRLAFADRFENKLPEELYEVGISAGAATLLRDMALLPLLPSQEP